MNQNIYIFCPVSTFGLPSSIFDRIKLSDTRLWMGNGSVSLIIYLLVTFSLDWCIYWMALRDVLLLNTPWLYICTVQLFQHVHFLYIYAINQVVRTFLIFWCWNCCLQGSLLSWNLLCQLFCFLKCFDERGCSFWCQRLYRKNIFLTPLLCRNIK